VSVLGTVPNRAAPPLRLPVALAVAVLVLLSGAACRDKSAPETTAPPGFVAVRDSKSGFAVAVPSDWTQIPLPQDIEIFDRRAQELSLSNPNLGPAIIQARQLLQYGGKVMAVSPDGNSIVNVTGDKAKEKSLTEIGRSTAKSLEENGATELVQEQASTGAGPALKFRFKYPLAGKGDTITMADEVQYYLLEGGRSWVITVINGSNDLADAVAQSFRLR
jgi:hypothetical protein